MRNTFKVLLCTGFMGLLATAAAANTVEKIFPNAESVGEQTENAVHYLLPLGRVKEDRAAGRVQPSKYQRLDGNLVALTWRLDSALTLQDARRQVDAYLDAQKPERLFQCEGRDCGESFAWADTIFNQSVLFGSDRTQHLWVVKDRDAPRYHVLYLVERPNRRIYLHEDTLLVPVDMQSVEQAVQALSSNGRIIVGGVPVRDGQGDFNNVLERVQAWRPEVSYPLVLVLHRHGQSVRDAELAAQLRTLLKTKNIQGRVEDVGPLAPDPNAPASVWVEWVNPAWTPDQM